MNDLSLTPGTYRVDSITDGIVRLETPQASEIPEPYIHLPIAAVAVPAEEGDFLRYSPATGWTQDRQEEEKVRQRVRSKLDRLRNPPG